MSDHIPQGIYKGRAIHAEYKESNKKNEPYLEILCEVTEDGPYKGRRLACEGYFNTEANGKRTMGSLVICGWDGEDPYALVGLGTTEISLDIRFEPARPKEDGSGEYPARSRISFINELGSTATGHSMSDARKATFYGDLMALKQNMGIGKKGNGAGAAPGTAAPSGSAQGAVGKIPF